jgi:hypothetical protein
MALNLKKIFLSTLMSGVLMFPYLGSFSHLFEDHDHKTCEISETHLHELELDCDILDYQYAHRLEISSYSYGVFVYSFQQNKLPFFNEGDSFSIDISYTLRGPPTL